MILLLQCFIDNENTMLSMYCNILNLYIKEVKVLSWKEIIKTYFRNAVSFFEKILATF